MEYRCPNLSNCSKADSRAVIAIPKGADAICPECGSSLLRRSNSGKSPVPLVLGAVALVAFAGIALFVRHLVSPSPRPSVVAVTPLPSPTPTPTPRPVVQTPLPSTPAPSPPAATHTNVVLRLRGASTLGETLVPALVEAFFKQEQATSIEKIVGNEIGKYSIQGLMPGGTNPSVAEISPARTSTALSELGTKKCDVALASRKLTAHELEDLRVAGLGDMTSKESEHVVALDALAIVVHPGNPVSELSKEQLEMVFSGQIGDWAQIKGGAPGKITVCALDSSTDTGEAFDGLVMTGSKVIVSAARFRDSNELSDKVCSDPNAIGFVELPAIGNAKAIAISSGGGSALLPNQFEIATEDYPLSRRLYLYTSSGEGNARSKKFVSFALSKAGQEVVEKTRFVSMRPRVGAWKVPSNAPKEYAEYAKNAERLDLNFRFQTASSQLDNKALSDLDRLSELLSGPAYRGRFILLFGFADSVGSTQANITLSKARAETVAQQLRQKGIAPAVVTGFGKELPVDSNDTELGREKNRRVEIWLRR